MTSDKSGAAFPRVVPEFGDAAYEPGMTLRQWYAGMALQGILSNPSNSDITPPLNPESTSKYCFIMADAMLAEGAKDA